MATAPFLKVDAENQSMPLYKLGSAAGQFLATEQIPEELYLTEERTERGSASQNNKRNLIFLSC
jgi:hypothetical protein